METGRKNCKLAGNAMQIGRKNCKIAGNDVKNGHQCGYIERDVTSLLTALECTVPVFEPGSDVSVSPHAV